MLKTKSVVICRSNPVAPDPRVEKTAVALVENGYKVSILGWDRTGGLVKQQSLAGFDKIKINRLAISAAYGRGWRNLIALIRWEWSLLSWLIHRRAEYEIIHACDFDTAIPALLVKWVFGKKMIYDIFDFYADH